MERKELYRYIGNSGQVYGVRRVILDEGNARGIARQQEGLRWIYCLIPGWTSGTCATRA